MRKETKRLGEVKGFVNEANPHFVNYANPRILADGVRKGIWNDVHPYVSQLHSCNCPPDATYNFVIWPSASINFRHRAWRFKGPCRSIFPILTSLPERTLKSCTRQSAVAAAIKSPCTSKPACMDETTGPPEVKKVI